jgi:hypothetical protein
MHNLMPEKYKELYREISAGVPIFQRDQKIALLKDWWAKEGERLVTAKCPSVVEVLLKEAEERSKQQEKASDAGTGRGGDAAKDAEQKAKESEQKPKEAQPNQPPGK